MMEPGQLREPKGLNALLVRHRESLVTSRNARHFYIMGTEKRQVIDMIIKLPTLDLINRLELSLNIQRKILSNSGMKEKNCYLSENNKSVPRISE